MADEENFLDDDVVAGGAESESGERGGVLSGALVNILKWIAIGLAAIILVATVSYVTFSLFIRGRQSEGLSEFSTEAMRPDLKLEFFSVNLTSVRGQTADDPPLSFLASVSIGYEAGDMPIQTELNDNKEIIQNEILLFLGQKTAKELTTRNLEKLQGELKNIINNTMRSGLIDRVLFSELQTF